MLVTFQSAGSCLEISDVWKILVRGSAITSAVSFNSLGCILSGPGDLLASNFSKRLRTSVDDTVVLSIGAFTLYFGGECKGPSGSVVKTEPNCRFSKSASLLVSVVSSPCSVISF